MRTLFWIKVSFFSVMVATFSTLNIWPSTDLLFGFLLGFLGNVILKKLGYEFSKVSFSFKWIILFGTLVLMWYYLATSMIHFYLIGWLVRLSIVCFFFWPEISLWKRKNIHDKI